MLKKTRLLLAAVIGFGILHTSCHKDDEQEAATKVKVAGLYSLTGNWSSLGVNSKAAMELAVNDVNLYFQEQGLSYTFSSETYDTKLDPDLAQHYLEQIKDKGIRFVIGPQSSAEVAKIKNYADDNQMIIVSQGSTSGSLAIEQDNIFRFCPSDALEGAALAKSIFNQGIRGLVTLARGDAGNKGLQQSITKHFTELGGTVRNIDPYAENAASFDDLISQAEAGANELIAMFGADNVGIYLASFDECVHIFKKANTVELLSDLQWFGSDGVALSSAITADSIAASFAIKTKYYAPAFGLPEDAMSKWQPLSSRIEARTGIQPDAFALAVYDAVWVWALTIAGTNNGGNSLFAKLKSAFVAQANSYYGATGATLLNQAGDRAIGSFDYWGIEEKDGSFVWKLVGKSE